ncbi:hypothetical protein KAFR_0B06950 [Kazachstania africana CBS 2517]|uniref:Putative 5'-nucleotidase C-terminal domain-containing protein n=1 Tax=Kazachstania africana (strain ATCC 22294 / BCRC 22015 / CBS 2517 / CECT 1963 / NBRC 1671 / NRRL Y-8276) TaxID=1071382 RepID=H2ARJ2_KAZAF|nr:hypothetical protein KAFR_0B06950 [Kazachstania africana CBS 2517]CCF56992.1 hypothetical protein KAFR_0B06950 [Kazachstania africana CBS 2517]
MVLIRWIVLQVVLFVLGNSFLVPFNAVDQSSAKSRNAHDDHDDRRNNHDDRRNNHDDPDDRSRRPWNDPDDRLRRPWNDPDDRSRRPWHDHDDHDNRHSDIHIRDLTMGQLNFIHTTDTHGWLGSHRLQRDYDADWGDFISFLELFDRNRMNEYQDLLIIDTGDKHDGNGLSDGTRPLGMISTHIFNQVDYDLLTLGNHELYTPETAIFEYYSTAMSKKFRHKYISSNVEFLHDKKDYVPFGNKYVYFETPKNRLRILSLSFIFNVRKNNPRVRITRPIDELQKIWFHEMIELYPEDRIDILIVIGHLPLVDSENNDLSMIHSYLRRFYPNIIIQYFGGHTHIRDFIQLDSRSTGLQSGQYAETLGFLSIDDVHNESPRFSRRYIDFNTRSFRHHSNTEHRLESDRGHRVKRMIRKLRRELNLDVRYGYVPRNYYMYSRPIDADDNIYNLMRRRVLPRLRSRRIKNSRSYDRFILLNTGAIRYDLYRGPFTRDTEYIVLPFSNTWKYIRLPLYIARRIEEILNGRQSIVSLPPPTNFIRQATSESCPTIVSPNYSEGYTTEDDYGCDGDDTPHRTVSRHHIPNVIQTIQFTSNEQYLTDDDIVHFIFFSYLERDVLRAINLINKEPSKIYTEFDSQDYGGQSAQELLREYIREIS